MIPIEIQWLGHNSWRIQTGQTAWVVDPFLLLPSSPCKAGEIQADYVLVTHGHADHCASALEILQKNRATLVGIAEVTDWFGKKGKFPTEPMNIGGSIPLAVRGGAGEEKTARVLMTPALHSSTMPDGQSGGNSCGFILSLPKSDAASDGASSEIRPLTETLTDYVNLYFAGDTGYFSEMKEIGELGIDAAFLPVGDRFTMGPAMSLDALRTIRPKRVFPAHFNSWPPIAQNIDAWADAVRKWTDAEPIPLQPGEKWVWK